MAVALTCDSRRIVLQTPGQRRRGWSCSRHHSRKTRKKTGRATTRVPCLRALQTARRPPGWNRCKPPAWQQALTAIASRATTARIARPDPPAGQIPGVIDLAASRQASNLSVHLRQEQRQSGEWGLPKAARLAISQIANMPEGDRTILERLLAAHAPCKYRAGSAPRVAVACASGATVARDLPADVPDRTPPAGHDADRVRCVRRIPAVDACLGRQPRSGVPGASNATAPREATTSLWRPNRWRRRHHPALRRCSCSWTMGVAITEKAAMFVSGGGVMPWMQQLFGRGTIGGATRSADRPSRDAGVIRRHRRPVCPEEFAVTHLVEATPTPHLVLCSQRGDSRLLR